LKEINLGKQMKSVWTIKPPEPWEKKFGKHPTQKPVALLERILLASTNEGDLVLDPFSGSSTTLLAALRLNRHAYGFDLDLTYAQLTTRRLCSELAHVTISVSSFHFSVDLFSRSMDRSDRASQCSGRLLRRAPFANDAPPMPDVPRTRRREAQFFLFLCGRLDARKSRTVHKVRLGRIS
jgi:hypothetical protein